MDEPARKRRRTNSPPEPERQSSPLRKPPRRPSFASPTKASLARNYPNLLGPASARGNASSHSSRSAITARGKQARAFVLGEAEIQGNLNQAASEGAQESTAAAQPQLSRAQDATPLARKMAGYKDVSTTTPVLDEDGGDLPPTSSERGLQEQDSPRRGVLFSSPSKRPPRAKNIAPRSPLKPKEANLQMNTAVSSSENGLDEAQGAPKAENKPLVDPQVEKKKQEKARLKRELEELESQVSKCVEEIAKEQRREPEQALRETERRALRDVIIKASGVNPKDENPVPVSTLLCSFLPFPALVISQPGPSQPEKPAPSHRPLELRDPLPFLEMFTSLKFSTRLDLPPGKILPSLKRVHQKHTVDIVGPQKLLAVQVSVVIDVLATEVADMQIVRLPSWAERELGTFLRDQAEQKDFGNACWAIDSYWAVAQKRAQHWAACQAAFAHLITGRTNEDTENPPPQTKTAQTTSRKDLSRHLGRDTLVLQDKHVLLKLNWRVSFDWTGEAESDVTVEYAVPAAWQEADAAGNLKKVPETFAALLRDKGAYEATRIMVALLFAR